VRSTPSAARGVSVAIISNSEGMLNALFASLGVLQHFDLVLDSGTIGLEKPDPRIFRMALDHFGVSRSAPSILGRVRDGHCRRPRSWPPSCPD